MRKDVGFVKFDKRIFNAALVSAVTYRQGDTENGPAVMVYFGDQCLTLRGNDALEVWDYFSAISIEKLS